MDQKTWLWRERCLKELIAANSEAEISVKGNEEVAALLCECNGKDKLKAGYAKAAIEAIPGREKGKVEVATQKQELEDALQQKVATNERLVYLNAALKSCRQQLSSLKVEQDQRIILERAHKRLESKYTEARKKLANLTVKNARLTKALVMKGEIIEDVNNKMSEATAKFSALISRLDSTERGNDVLKYEYRVLERELKIRNRRAGVENRQHQENAKRVAKLEAERQRLRLLVRKRIPGRAKTKPSNHPKAMVRRMSSMMKRLCDMVEENKILKENACKRENEIHLLKVELGQLRGGERNIGTAKQYKMIGSSDMSLMGDNGEMEKLAIVSVDAPSSDKDNLDMVGQELVPAPQVDAFNSSEKEYDWLHGILKEILEQNDASEKSFDELVEDIRIALQSRYHSSSMEENGEMINKLDDVKPVYKDLEAKLLESENKTLSLKTKLESLEDLKRMTEDHLENLKLVNVDLDHQLSVANVQIKEALQKVSYLEMELEDRSHHCEELEATCLELQLLLASVSGKDVEKEYVEQEKLLQTGLEMTSELTNNKKSSQHSSLPDHMAGENGVGTEDLLKFPMIKEIISTIETKETSASRYNTCNTSCRVKNAVPRALPVVSSKKRGKSTESLRKLLFGRKRGGNKKLLLTFATYHTDLIFEIFPFYPELCGRLEGFFSRIFNAASFISRSASSKYFANFSG